MKKSTLYIVGGGIALAVLVAALVSRTPEISPSERINIPTTQYPTLPPSAPSYTAIIQRVDPSGYNGTVKFEDIAGAVAIKLHLDGIDEEEIVPVELHHGSCANIATLAYTLAAPDAGESETDLTIDLKQFNAEKPMAVVVYRSFQDRTVTACGDLP